MLACGIALVTVGLIRMFQLYQKRNDRQLEIRAFNAGTTI